MKPFVHLLDVTDFELPDGTTSGDWFKDAFEVLGIDEMIEYNVYDGTLGSFPDLDELEGNKGGIIISGSGGAVFEEKQWIPPLLQYIREVHSRGVWMLGVCFGHHALATALGGEVKPNPRGREMGTVIIFLTEEGKKSRLFKGFRSGDRVNLVHKTHVTRLPENAKRLAFNQLTPTQSFQIGRSFGFQPHPELTPVQLKQLVDMFGDIMMEKEGFIDDEDHMKNFSHSFMDAPAGRLILRNFIDIISEKQ
jgi:GMP synthase-like glutamine amidotransferase